MAAQRSAVRSSVPTGSASTRVYTIDLDRNAWRHTWRIRNKESHYGQMLIFTRKLEIFAGIPVRVREAGEDGSWAWRPRPHAAQNDLSGGLFASSCCLIPLRTARD